MAIKATVPTGSEDDDANGKTKCEQTKPVRQSDGRLATPKTSEPDDIGTGCGDFPELRLSHPATRFSLLNIVRW